MKHTNRALKENDKIHNIHSVDISGNIINYHKNNKKINNQHTVDMGSIDISRSINHSLPPQQSIRHDHFISKKNFHSRSKKNLQKKSRSKTPTRSNLSKQQKNTDILKNNISPLSIRNDRSRSKKNLQKKFRSKTLTRSNVSRLRSRRTAKNSNKHHKHKNIKKSVNIRTTALKTPDLDSNRSQPESRPRRTTDNVTLQKNFNTRTRSKSPKRSNISNRSKKNLQKSFNRSQPKSQPKSRPLPYPRDSTLVFIDS